jgi:hypothetical protein
MKQKIIVAFLAGILAGWMVPAAADRADPMYQLVRVAEQIARSLERMEDCKGGRSQRTRESSIKPGSDTDFESLQ